MKMFSKVKDGGPYSRVTAYFLIEWKRFFSIGLLRFDEGSREAYHSHAFNCISWVLCGGLKELQYVSSQTGGIEKNHRPSFLPVMTYRNTLHQVHGIGSHTWVLTFRGPWTKTWTEFVNEKFVTLTSGRKEVTECGG